MVATAVRYLREAVADAARQLEDAGCATPRLDAELLVAAALGTPREQIHLDFRRLLNNDVEAAIATLVRRRAAREPIAYILGRRAFRRIELEVDPRVLVPRPETELLVDAAIGLPDGARVHEVGTGSGAVALAIKDERPDLGVTASDTSPEAVEVARRNAARLGVDVEIERAADLPAGAAGADLVVANLPYVREDEWPDLAPEITRYEPRGALVAGPGGLEAIEALVVSAPSRIRVALEHAPSQAEAIRGVLAGGTTLRDLAGLERVTVGHIP